MRRVGPAAVMLVALTLVGCDTDPPTDRTDTGVTLHGSGNCAAGTQMWWTYNMRRIYEDGSVGAWVDVGPQQYVNCTSNSAEVDLPQRVEGLPSGAAWEYKIVSYTYNNGQWHSWDSNGTQDGTDFDQAQTSQTQTLEGGSSECNPNLQFCVAGERRAARQLMWVVSWDRGIGRKNAPSADTHIWRKDGAVSILLRCRVDARYTGDLQEGWAGSGWVRPDNNKPCWANYNLWGTMRFVGTRHYIRAYLNDTRDWWIEGFRAAGRCTTEIYSDNRDLLRCDSTNGADPPPRSDP
jgi:hypothetical protein